MRICRLALSTLAAGALVVPVLAAPAPGAPPSRITLRMENASLHQVLLKLNEITGLQFREQSGAGNQGFREPPNSKRAPFDWKNVAIGKVVRQLCTAFGLQANAMGESGYWFSPGELPKRVETSSSGVAFSINYISQFQSIDVTPGAGDANTLRGVSLQFVCRAEDGDADMIGPITRLSVTDEQGRKHDARPQAYGWDGQTGMPDEKVRSVWIPWSGPHAQRFTRLEGELAFYSTAEEERFVFSLPQTGGVTEQQKGPVHLKVQRLIADGSGADVELRVEWPKDAQVNTWGRGSIRAKIRQENGQELPLGQSTSNGLTRDGTQYARIELTGQFQGATPRQLEVVVPVRSGAGRKVPFEMSNITLPYSKPFQPRLKPLNQKPYLPSRPGAGGVQDGPPAFADRDGGVLALPAFKAPKGATSDGTFEAAVGLSRRKEDGSWTPVRWTQIQVGPEPLRLKGLAPGRYSVRLRYWLRREEGAPRRLSIPDRTGEVEIRKGAETTFQDR